jgi:hypothetical protein
MEYSMETLIDGIIHKYVDPNGIILVDRIIRNWEDPKDAVKWMLIVFSRFYGVKSQNFDKLIADWSKITMMDLHKNKGCFTASLVYWSICADGKEMFTQNQLSKIFGISESIIRKQQVSIQDILRR